MYSGYHTKFLRISATEKQTTPLPTRTILNILSDRTNTGFSSKGTIERFTTVGFDWDGDCMPPMPQGNPLTNTGDTTPTRIERDFARLKGKSLGIRPLYVQREDHLVGLVRLLSLALRLLTAIEYVV